MIIPTKNSARTIAKCLQSLQDQTFRNLEVLVIDALSNDGTQETSANNGAEVVVLEGERTKAKNFGIARAKGEYLLFIDSDMILDQRVIEDCVRVCEDDEKIAGVVIPERSVGSGFWVSVRDFERNLYSGLRVESARFFVKRFAADVGGFDEDILTYEESTLPNKLEERGYNVNARISSSIVHDEEGFSLVKWLSKKKYYGGTHDLYVGRYPDYAHAQLSVTRRVDVFLSNGKWKKLVKNPILTVGLVILKSLEFLALRL